MTWYRSYLNFLLVIYDGDRIMEFVGLYDESSPFPPKFSQCLRATNLRLVRTTGIVMNVFLVLQKTLSGLVFRWQRQPWHCWSLYLPWLGRELDVSSYLQGSKTKRTILMLIPAIGLSSNRSRILLNNIIFQAAIHKYMKVMQPSKESNFFPFFQYSTTHLRHLWSCGVWHRFICQKLIFPPGDG